jgi:hypothetical protein
VQEHQYRPGTPFDIMKADAIDFDEAPGRRALTLDLPGLLANDRGAGQ